MGCGVNLTCTETNESGLVWWRGMVVAILAVIFLMASVGNLLVILVVAWIPEMRTRTNMFLVNLSISGIGVATLCIPFTWVTVLINDWIFGEAWCKVNGFMNSFWLTATIFTLSAISIHKYFTVVKPLRRIITKSRAVFMIVMIWVMAMLCAIGPLVGWNQIVFKENSAQCSPDLTSRNIRNTSHIIFILVVVYVLPMLIMSVLYWKVYRAVNQHCKRIRQNTIIDAKGVQAQKRMVITLCIVVLIYFLCWTPFCLYKIVLLLVDINDFSSSEFLLVAYIFGYSNAAWNPLIFAFRNARYRRGFREVISCIACSPKRNCSKRTNAKLPNESTLDLVVQARLDTVAEFYNMEKRCSIWFLPERPGVMSLQLEAVAEENNDLEQEIPQETNDNQLPITENIRKDSRRRSSTKQWRKYILKKVGWIETNV